MEDNNRPTSEFENLVKEATGEIPTVNAEPKEEVKESDIQIVDDQVTTEEKVEEKPTVKEDIQVVDDGSSIELPQTKEGIESSIPKNLDTATPSSQTIGTVKQDKQKSPIAMLVLFGGLIAFILFMPSAIDLFNKYFGTDLNIDSLNNPQKVEETKPNDEKQEVKMYDLTEDTVIQIGKIDFGGFKKVNNEGFSLDFYVKNNGTILYKFDKKVYLEYYDDNKTFIGRSYLENVKEITGGITNTYNISLDNPTFNKATKIEVILRTDDDYPAIELNNQELTCVNETNDLTYTFDESSKLIEVQDVYTYIKGDDVMKYSNDLISYKTKIGNLDKLDGVTAILSETPTGFITNTAIDYRLVDYSKLSSNTNYYVKDTYAKTISFEMNAKGYTCK